MVTEPGAALAHPEPPGWDAFAVFALIGCVTCLMVYVPVALGECLPRDGSARMRACDRTAQIGAVLYPLVVALILAIAVRLQVTSKRAGRNLAIASGLISIPVFLLIRPLVVLGAANMFWR